MYLFRRAFLAPTLVLAFCAATTAATAETPYGSAAEVGAGSGRPTALSSADRISYTTAFDALRRGDIETAALVVDGGRRQAGFDQLQAAAVHDLVVGRRRHRHRPTEVVGDAQTHARVSLVAHRPLAARSPQRRSADYG